MTEEQKLEYLKEQGIDAALGMRYADDSLAFYLELIDVFLGEYESKRAALQKEAEKETKNYTVLVHGLKNNAGSLGALELSKVACEHEVFSREGEWKYVKENLPILLEKWDRTAQIFQKLNG